MEEHGDDDETMERSDNVEAMGEQEFPAITWNQSLCWFLNFGICFLSFPSRSQLLGIRYVFPAHHCVQGVEVWAMQSMGGKWVQDVHPKQTWYLSKNLHNQIFGPKILHTKSVQITTIFTKKN